MKASLIKDIKLLPVIELEPMDYGANRTYDPDTGSDGREAYNRLSYADGGLINIQPIEKGSWLFEIDTLSNTELRIIIKKVLDISAENFDSIQEIFSDPAEYAPFIAGGFLVMIDENIVCRPGCCCGLESIVEWRDASYGQTGEVWTGHDKDDSFNVRSFNGSTFDVTIGEVKRTIDSSTMQKAVELAEYKVKRFINRTAPMVNELFGVKNGFEIVNAMVYN